MPKNRIFLNFEIESLNLFVICNFEFGAFCYCITKIPLQKQKCPFPGILADDAHAYRALATLVRSIPYLD